MLVFFTNLSLMEFQVRHSVLCCLFLVKDSFKWLWMGSGRKNIQLINAGAPQGSILGATLVIQYMNNDLPHDVICSNAVSTDDTTLYSKSDQASDLLQQLELASELESVLQDTVDWSRKWLVNFNAGKTQLVSFDQSNNTYSINVKLNLESALEEK